MSIASRFIRAQLLRSMSSSSHQLKETGVVDDVLNFDQMPTDRGLPVFGTIPYYMTGRYSADDPTEHKIKQYRRFGDIFREKIGNNYLVNIMHPRLIEQVFRQEGRYPISRGNPTVEKSAMTGELEDTPTILDSGEAWRRARTITNRFYFHKPALDDYVLLQVAAADMFVKALQLDEDVKHGTITDVVSWCQKYICEGLGRTTFGVDMKMFSDEVPTNRLDFLNAVDRLIYIGVLNMVKPPNSRRELNRRIDEWRQVDDTIGKEIVDIMSEKARGVTAPGCPAHSDVRGLQQRMFEDFKTNKHGLTEPQLQYYHERASAMAFIAGQDMTTGAMTVLLYFLSRHPEKQQKLYEEIVEVLGDGDITGDKLRSMRYLRACFREAFRLIPTSTANLRFFDKEVVIGGYKVPKGVTVLTWGNLAYQLPEFVDRSNEFIPERYLRGNDDIQHADPFGSMPFGFGPRQCLGKHIAETLLYIGTCKLLQQYRISCDQPSLKYHYKGILKIDSCLNFKVEKRI